VEQIAIEKGYGIFLLLQLGELRGRSYVRSGWDDTEWEAGAVFPYNYCPLFVNRLECGLIGNRHSFEAGVVINAERVTIFQNMPEMGFGLMGRIGLVRKFLIEQSLLEEYAIGDSVSLVGGDDAVGWLARGRVAVSREENCEEDSGEKAHVGRPRSQQVCGLGESSASTLERQVKKLGIIAAHLPGEERYT
jgi:hypothetical protein